ncbi:hypothetical protein EDD29_9088 [Actinocorallia herbida]|uniref:Uncharacterized protein n=1 Tax=Actinocorallia herbida TaxID=58109 RepID=A0A3N1DCT5_9ACTN|nr:hypothetical protein [Actinocorallia herbida]ROO91334.1 hypothetical protein EDD29_9088 [Actinocorallia herbida]
MSLRILDFLEAVVATPFGLAGAVALAAVAGLFSVMLGAVVYEDLQPKGRHHRARRSRRDGSVPIAISGVS